MYIQFIRRLYHVVSCMVMASRAALRAGQAARQAISGLSMYELHSITQVTRTDSSYIPTRPT